MDMKNAWKIEQHYQRKTAQARIKEERKEFEQQARLISTNYSEFKTNYPGIVIHDLTGFIFGNLKVLAKITPHVSPSGYIASRYLCECDCGDHLVVYGQELTRGAITDCGCISFKIKI